MKVKKLLTLLLATSMIVACGTTTSNSASSSSSEPASSSTSSDVPSTSSSSSNTSSESSSSSSSAPSTSSSSSAPSTSSSSSNSSTSTSAPVVVTLVSISVTAPTKLAYTTADTELDLTGMVVTANYSDATQRVITEGYTVSPVDFSTAGDKTVTVTFEGKTDSFTITVAQAKPTAWDAGLTAKFQANLYGYVPPFFYSPDFGLGELTWRENAEDKALWALGGSVAAMQAGEDSPLKPVADLFIADGFVASIVPNAEEGYYFYIMNKAVTYETKQRYVEVRIASINSKGSFANGGQFYIEIGDSYFYSWAESGVETAIKSALKFNEDIPDVPDEIRFLKRALTIIPEQAKNGYAEVEFYDVSTTDANNYLATLDNANWGFKSSNREGIKYDIFSPQSTIRLGFGYDSAEKTMTLRFDEPATVPDYVHYVADLYGIPGRGLVFNYSSQYDNYFYTFADTLADGETLDDLLDKYDAVLKADTEGAFVQKGTRQSPQEGLMYETFNSPTKGVSVTLYAFNDEDGIGVQITVEQYGSVPAQFLPAMSLLGFSIDDMNVAPATPVASAYAYTQVKSAKTVAYADALKAFTDILDNDTTLGFQIIVPLEDTTMQSGEAAKHIEYADGNVKIQFLAWTNRSNTIVQAVFYDYIPAPESQFVEDVEAALTDYELAWDDETRSFRYVGKRTLASGETMASVVAQVAESLLNVDKLALDILVTLTSDAKEAKYILYSEEGSIEIRYSQYYSNGPLLFIDVRAFDKDIDIIVNAIGSLMGVTLKETAQAGQFKGAGEYAFSQTLGLQQYGEILIEYYIAESLIACSALGFQMTGLGPDGNNYVAQFANEEGYIINITLLGDAEKNYTGYYEILVIAPQD